MKNLSRIATAIVFAFASVGAVHAAHHDFHFFDQGAQGKCLSRSPTPS